MAMIIKGALKKKSKGQKNGSEVDVVKRNIEVLVKLTKMYGLQQRSEGNIQKSQLQYL